MFQLHKIDMDGSSSSHVFPASLLTIGIFNNTIEEIDYLLRKNDIHIPFTAFLSLCYSVLSTPHWLKQHQQMVALVFCKRFLSKPSELISGGGICESWRGLAYQRGAGKTETVKAEKPSKRCCFLGGRYQAFYFWTEWLVTNKFCWGVDVVPHSPPVVWMRWMMLWRHCCFEVIPMYVNLQKTCYQRAQLLQLCWRTRGGIALCEFCERWDVWRPPNFFFSLFSVKWNRRLPHFDHGSGRTTEKYHVTCSVRNTFVLP